MNNIPSTSDIKNYVQGNINYFTQRSLPQYQLEQIELRKFLCSSCASSTHCSQCGCKSPNLFYSPSKIDANKKWGPFMSEVQWEILKANIDQYAEFIKVLRLKSGDVTRSIGEPSDSNQVLELQDSSLPKD